MLLDASIGQNLEISCAAHQHELEGKSSARMELGERLARERLAEHGPLFGARHW